MTKGWHGDNVRHANAKVLGKAGPFYKKNIEPVFEKTKDVVKSIGSKTKTFVAEEREIRRFTESNRQTIKELKEEIRNCKDNIKSHLADIKNLEKIAREKIDQFKMKTKAERDAEIVPHKEEIASYEQKIKNLKSEIKAERSKMKEKRKEIKSRSKTND